MLKRHAALLIVATVLLGAGAYAWAQETPSPPDTGTQADPPRDGARHRAGHRLRALRRAVHAEVTVEGRDGQFRTLQIDRGTLVEATATSVTVERADGERVTREVNDETRVRGADDLTALEQGAPTMVVAEGGTALFVGQRKQDPAAS